MPTAYADNSNTIKSYVTESYYSAVAKEFNAKDYSDLDGLEDHPSLMWAENNSTRADLVASLILDINANDEKCYKNYIDGATSFYILLKPMNAETFSGYLYNIIIMNGKKNLTIAYAPGASVLSYFTAELDLNESDIKSLAKDNYSKVWIVSESDIEKSIKLLEVVAPKPISTPTVLSDDKIDSLVVEALYKELQRRQRIIWFDVDPGSCKYNINKTEKGNEYTYVYGTVVLYDKFGSISTSAPKRNFTIKIDQKTETVISCELS